MGQDWNLNIPLLEKHGNFGSRLVRDAAAPRYIFAELHKSYDVIFKDSNIAPSSSDIEDPDPKHYLPIIPWVLVNGSEGIAVGYATNILPRDPIGIVKQCLNALEGKKMRDVVIKYPQFNGSIEMEGNTAIISGVANRIKNTFHVTELPVGYDREKYFNILDKLVEDKVIYDFNDRCSEDGFNFEVICKKTQADSIEKKGTLKTLKLIKRNAENFNLLDDIMSPKEKVISYDSSKDYIKDFVAMRTKFYGLRLTRKISEITEKIEKLEAKRTFVKAVLSKPSILKQQKQSLTTELQAKYNIAERFCESVISMPAYSFCTDKVTELEDSIKAEQAQMQKLKNTKPSDLYKKELEDLLKWLQVNQRKGKS
jgi:DNA topoisomerase-2